ncbi:HAD family hydrolase [Kosmotoga pacifica]|uniref:HAD family hydrolase n=1 Tax=Kosmotoga pacifica TaxID=1330330 RepID=A0A0G2ZBH4_9BACT|nr:HAD family hydrolase [Kosmotoga pacifica]AKI96929.1 hypothetical protein IX53_02830 [Kosmotoga pacifica]
MFCYLFDLDGTLTRNSDEEFIRLYFRLIAKHTGNVELTNRIKSAVFIAIETISRNTDGRNNFDRFMENFAMKMGSGTPEYWTDFFMDFYNTTYDELRNFVAPRNEVIETLKKLKSQGHRIVLATNPVFPSIAIEKRIRWIGLNPSDFHYITTMENSYNLKPSAEYYKRILEEINCVPENSIMIGNDPILDGACGKVGIQFIDVSSIEKIIDDMKN